MIPFDLHTHCTLSFDGKSSAEDMVKRAVELGIKHYALTDHIDLGEFPDKDFDLEATVAGAKEQIPALQKKYAESTELLYGVELGQAVHDRELTEKLLAENDYDFVIGSTHFIRGHEDFYFLNYTDTDVPELMRLYFEELLETAEWGRFDIMGHITYPLRYITGEHGINVDLSEYGSIIDEILRTLIRNGKGIEINTSGLRQKYGRMFPDADTVRRYRELGGEILTVGSDAHCTDDLGKGIAEGIKLAKDIGFDKIAYYKRREVHFIAI